MKALHAVLLSVLLCTVSDNIGAPETTGTITGFRPAAARQGSGTGGGVRWFAGGLPGPHDQPQLRRQLPGYLLAREHQRAVYARDHQRQLPATGVGKLLHT